MHDSVEEAVRSLEIVILEHVLGELGVVFPYGKLACLNRTDGSALAAAHALGVNHGSVIGHRDGIERAALGTGTALNARVAVDDQVVVAHLRHRVDGRATLSAQGNVGGKNIAAITVARADDLASLGVCALNHHAQVDVALKDGCGLFLVNLTSEVVLDVVLSLFAK